MQENGEDQRLPHHKNPPEYVSMEELEKLGVLYWHLDPEKYENDPDLQKIREARGYSYMVYDLLSCTCNFRRTFLDISFLHSCLLCNETWFASI